MKTLIYILSVGALGLFSLIANKKETTSNSLLQNEYHESKTNTHKSLEYQPNVDLKETMEVLVRKRLQNESRRYTPDNNPVTYDDNPGNYPLNRPKTYRNVDNNEIQSPTGYNSVPPGACAICRDGTYSFSRHHQGTCSHHGGVSQWLR